MTSLVLTALMGASNFAWVQAQRQAHFPLGHNVVPAHITLFRQLPPSILREAKVRIGRICAGTAPAARLAAVMLLDRGVAYRVDSPALLAIRAELADAFAGLLMPHDIAPPRLHVTVQNKVSPEEARALAARLRVEFTPRHLSISGLAVWHYRDGPWDLAAKSAFRS